MVDSAVLDTYSPSAVTARPDTRGCSIATGFVKPKGIGADYFTGDLVSTASALKSNFHYLWIRDLYGYDEDTDPNYTTTYRPPTLVEVHAYNLLNQGWTPASIAKFFNELAVYPSNADVPYFGLVVDTNSAANPPPMLYDAEVLTTYPFPQGAPRGNYFISLNNIGNNRYTSAVQPFIELNTRLGLTLDAELLPESAANSQPISYNYALTSSTAFIGRVFYVGELYGEDYASASTSANTSPSWANAVFFSRVVETFDESSSLSLVLEKKVTDNANPYRCMSTLTPTDENFQPTPTDGGVIFVSGVDKILSVHSTRQSVIIVGTNGVWEIIPQDGFSPSTFTLNKILEVPISSTKGVVEAEDIIMIPTDAGIYSLQYDGDSRRTIASSVSDGNIRNWYAPRSSWIQAGVYDSVSREIRWLLYPPASDYVEDDIVEISQEELTLDLRLGSFATNTYPNVTVKCAEGSNFYWKGGMGTSSAVPLLSTYARLGRPYSIGDVGSSIDSKRNLVFIKLVGCLPEGGDVVVYEPHKGVFSDYGISYSSFMVTNPVTLGDTIRRKDIPYIWTHFYRSEDGFEDDGSGDWIPTNPSGCLMSARWDFSDSAASGKWTTPRQVYRYNNDYMPEDINDSFDYGFNIITTKNNLTGSGKAISLKFESDGNKDLQLIGFGAEIAVNGAV